MGIYVNPKNTDFQRALNSEIYIDKSIKIRTIEEKDRTKAGKTLPAHGLYLVEVKYLISLVSEYPVSLFHLL